MTKRHCGGEGQIKLEEREQKWAAAVVCTSCGDVVGLAWAHDSVHFAVDAVIFAWRAHCNAVRVEGLRMQ